MLEFYDGIFVVVFEKNNHKLVFQLYLRMKMCGIFFLVKNRNGVKKECSIRDPSSSPPFKIPLVYTAKEAYQFHCLKRL